MKYQDVIIAVTTIQYTVNSSQPPLELKPVWALSSLEILWPGHIEGLDCINVVLLIRFPWQECEKKKLSAARADFGCSSSVFCIINKQIFYFSVKLLTFHSVNWDSHYKIAVPACCCLWSWSCHVAAIQYRQGRHVTITSSSNIFRMFASTLTCDSLMASRN